MRRTARLLLVALLAASCATDSEEPASVSGDPAAAPVDEVVSGEGVSAGSIGTQLGTEIDVGTTESGCAGALWSRLHLVDVETGSVAWSVDTPWAPDGPAVLDGDTVVLVDRSFDRPAAVGYDLSSGMGLWQRTWDGSVAELVATDGERVVVGVAAVGYFVGARFFLVDAQGGSTVSTIRVGGVAHNDHGPEWWQAQVVIGPDAAAWDPFSDPVRALEGAVFSEYQPVVIGDVAVTTGGDRVGFASSDGSWETTIPVDAEFGAMSDVRVGEETVLILLGSDLGPNRRLVVLDRRDGSLRWTLDGIRDADLAGQQVIYDRRTTNPDGVGPTREVFLVDQQDPSVVAWSALADQPLGGFVGRLGGADHFVHQDPAIYPQAPYPVVGGTTEVQFFEPELRIYDGNGPGEVPMEGRNRDLRRDPGPDTAAGPGWTAVTIGQRVWLTSNGETQSIDLGDTPRHLLATDAGVLVTTGAEEVGCD